MKISLTFKSPDVISEALLQEGIERGSDEWYEAYEAIAKFVKYSEYVTIEVDTDDGTAIVKKA